MNNGKYDTDSYKLGQAIKADRLWGQIEDHTKICKTCNKEYIWHGRRNTKAFEASKFCSRRCANNRQSVWDNKISEGETDGKWIRYRAVAFNNHGKRCIVCNFDKVIEVHHLDHNRSNNSKENLVPLCPNHHMMIHRSDYSEEVLSNIKNYINGL